MNTSGAGRIAELEAALAAGGQREVLLAAEVASLRAALEYSVEQEAEENDGSTALICASKHGHTAAAQALLAAGADKEAKDNDGYTALILAIDNGCTEIAQALLAAGADKEVKNNYGGTALSRASAKGHAEIVALLKASIPVCVPVAGKGF